MNNTRRLEGKCGGQKTSFEKTCKTVVNPARQFTLLRIVLRTLKNYLKSRDLFDFSNVFLPLFKRLLELYFRVKVKFIFSLVKVPVLNTKQMFNA